MAKQSFPVTSAQKTIFDVPLTAEEQKKLIRLPVGFHFFFFALWVSEPSPYMCVPVNKSLFYPMCGLHFLRLHCLINVRP